MRLSAKVAGGGRHNILAADRARTIAIVRFMRTKRPRCQNAPPLMEGI
jgi:hypothetical protein